MSEADFLLNPPFTRSRARACNTRVLEPSTMAEPRANPSQFDLFLQRYEEQLARDQQSRERMEARLEELSRSLSNGPRLGGSSHEDRSSSERRRNGGSNSQYVPRYTKIDFPKYDGVNDPLVWLTQCEQFFDHQATLPEDKLSLASFHLEGEAQLWFFKMRRDNPPTS